MTLEINQFGTGVKISLKTFNRATNFRSPTVHHKLSFTLPSVRVSMQVRQNQNTHKLRLNDVTEGTIVYSIF